MPRPASSNRRGCRRCVRSCCSAMAGIPARCASPRFWRAARAAEAERIAELGAATAIRRADQHPVHLGHHRLSQRRDAVASQHPQQRLLHRRGDAADAAGPAVHSGAALSLLRHGAGQSRRGHPRRLHGVSRRRFRSARDAGNRRRGTLHRTARRADDVHRAARSSGIRPLRSVVAAHRHHGGLAVPDRSDEARRRQDESCPRSPSPTA